MEYIAKESKELKEDETLAMVPDETYTILEDISAGIESIHGKRERLGKSDCFVPVIHRDIKSENILLMKETIVAKVADLGEARLVETASTMTSVGTYGYTAPEVIRGQRYDTKADIFSMAIVAVELLTLQERYFDIRFDDDGTMTQPWTAIQDAVASRGLRPELPDYIGVSLNDLIKDSWNEDPAMRPNASEFRFRLRAIREEHDQMSLNMQKLMSKDRILSDKCNVHKAEEVARKLYAFVWSPEARRAANAPFASDTCIVTSSDEVLNKILAESTGKQAVAAVADLMFVGEGSQYRYVPEPLLPSDICVLDSSILVRFKSCLSNALSFAVENKCTESNDHDERGLSRGIFFFSAKSTNIKLKNSLIKMQPTLDNIPEESEKTKGAKLAGPASKPKRKLKKKLVKKKKRRDESDKIMENFMKAANYVREDAASRLDPMQKLQLLALFLQATEGDCPEKDTESASVLPNIHVRIRQEAWAKVRGKDTITAMKEYVALVTAILPGWKLSKIAGFSPSAGNVASMTKSIVTVWSLKVQLDENMQIAKIHVLQHDNNDDDWYDNHAFNDVVETIRDIALPVADRTETEAKSGLSKKGGYFEGLLPDLTIDDMICDPSIYDSRLEEDEFLFVQALEMANSLAIAWVPQAVRFLMSWFAAEGRIEQKMRRLHLQERPFPHSQSINRLHNSGAIRKGQRRRRSPSLVP